MHLLDYRLTQAPIDDEPLTPQEVAEIEEGIASLDRDGGVPHEVVLAELGL